MRRRESASGRALGLAGARLALAAGPGPRQRHGRARDGPGTRPSVPLSALRRHDDGVAQRAVRPAPLLGIGHRFGALLVWADGAHRRGDPGAGVHLATGLRSESVDDAAPMGERRRRWRAAGSHRRLAAVARGHVTSSRRRAGRGVPALARAGDRDARRAGVRGSRARCMRPPHRGRARAPPPPSRVVC